LGRIISQLRRLELIFSDMNHEIIIVNDGSTDDTLHVIQKEAESNGRIHVITYAQNKGKGYALREGILRSVGELTLLLDGDTEISLDHLESYIKEMPHWDILVGSKRHQKSQVHIPVFRQILSRIFNILVRSATGIKIKDTQVGLKMIRGSVCRRIFANLHVDRYAFDVELLFIASLFKLRVKEMPVNITVKSQFRLKEIVRMFNDLIRISYRYRVVKSYDNSLFSNFVSPDGNGINPVPIKVPELKI